jgi:hypothetical protein
VLFAGVFSSGCGSVSSLFLLSILYSAVEDGVKVAGGGGFGNMGGLAVVAEKKNPPMDIGGLGYAPWVA